MLSSLIPDQLVPQGHPIRHIKPIVDAALNELSLTFSQMYAEIGRPSIPPWAPAQVVFVDYALFNP